MWNNKANDAVQQLRRDLVTARIDREDASREVTQLERELREVANQIEHSLEERRQLSNRIEQLKTQQHQLSDRIRQAKVGACALYSQEEAIRSKLCSERPRLRLAEDRIQRLDNELIQALREVNTRDCWNPSSS